jgi:hypothetical protein
MSGLFQTEVVARAWRRVVKKIELPSVGIVIQLGEKNPDRPSAYLSGSLVSSGIKDSCPSCGEAECYRACDGADEDEEECRLRAEYNRVIDGIESLVLACACAGIDVSLPAFVEAIETAADAAANRF